MVETAIWTSSMRLKERAIEITSQSVSELFPRFAGFRRPCVQIPRSMNATPVTDEGIIVKHNGRVFVRE